MTEYEKSFFYIFNNKRKILSLYTLFSKLPYLFHYFSLPLVQSFAKLTADPKVNISSDQIYLPKILSNGIPVYEANRFGPLARFIKLLEGVLFTGAFLSMYPLLMLMGILGHLASYYRVFR